MGRFAGFRPDTLLEWRSAMTAQHLNNQRNDWTRLFYYETLWILAFSAAVVGSGIFALFSMAQNNPLL